LWSAGLPRGESSNSYLFFVCLLDVLVGMTPKCKKTHEDIKLPLCKI